MIDWSNTDFEHKTELPTVIASDSFRAMIVGGIGLHLEVVSHQVFSDSECRLVELFVAHRRTDLLIGKERGIAQSQTPMFRQHVAGLHIHTFTDENGGFRLIGKERLATGSSHEISGKGEPPVFEDYVGEVAF